VAPPTATAERVERLRHAFDELVPHNKALGLRVELADDGEAVTMRLPYDPRLVGDPEHGTLHGGAITAMMDACCGLAVFLELDEPKPVATLDLRIDYLRRAAAGRDVLARAEVHRITTHVAFVRALAYHAPAAAEAPADGTGGADRDAGDGEAEGGDPTAATGPAASSTTTSIAAAAGTFMIGAARPAAPGPGTSWPPGVGSAGSHRPPPGKVRGR
jgi:uncharacterized protein (TIGR00369 family)